MIARAAVLSVFVVMTLTAAGQERQSRAARPAEDVASSALRVATNANVTGTYGEVVLEGDACCTAAGVLLKAGTDKPSVAARAATSDATSGFVVFNAVNSELLRVQSDGVIAIGGATPSAWHWVVGTPIEFANTSISPGRNTDMHVNSNAYYATDHTWRYKIAGKGANYYSYHGTHNWRVAPDGAAAGLLLWTHAMHISNTGDVGIGTGLATPGARLHVGGGLRSAQFNTGNGNGYGITIDDLMATEAYGSGALLNMTGNSMIRVSNLQLGYVGVPVVASTGGLPLYLNRDTQQDVVIGQTAFSTGLRVESTGTSRFAGGVSVAGNMTVNGTITGARVIGATYQDLAEWVPSETDLAPGTVVVLSRDRTNAVMAATTAYDTTVAGVVSEQPGIILGEASSEKEMIATTGRVKVKADASRHPITIGDLLVSSDKPGLAMKSVPVEIAGVAMHRPGTIIGKALEPLAAGEREILVLLSLQ